MGTKGLQALEIQLLHDLEIISYPLNEWVPPRFTEGGEKVFDVLIVGGGQGGLAITFQLMRERVNNILTIDKADSGFEGPWSTYARMPILRSPKEVNGPDLNIPSLAFQSWYEALYGLKAWNEMGEIPTNLWAKYLIWYRKVLNLPVRNKVLLDAFEPFQDIQKASLTCLTTNEKEIIFTRKIVLATGIETSGEWRSPSISSKIPKKYWYHSSESIDFDSLAGKHVAVLGAGASAMDNAVVALQANAAKVKVFCRRPELQRIQPFKWLSFPGFLRHFHDLDDHWRFQFMEHVLGLREAFPKETWERINKYNNFSLETGTPWNDLSVIDKKVQIETPKGIFVTDFIIFGTGFVIDITCRPELRPHSELIALWRDRYLYPDRDNETMLLAYPYLGSGFEFLEKVPGTAPWLKNIHLFTFGATMSFGPSGSSINAMKFAVPHLVNAISKDLFFDDINSHFRSLKAYDLPEFLLQGETSNVAPNSPVVKRLYKNSFS